MKTFYPNFDQLVVTRGFANFNIFQDHIEPHKVTDYFKMNMDTIYSEPWDVRFKNDECPICSNYVFTKVFFENGGLNSNLQEVQCYDEINILNELF